MVVSTISRQPPRQVNRAQQQRRRTYRAHGRINRKFLPNTSICPVIVLPHFFLLVLAMIGTFNPTPSLSSCLPAYMSSPCHVELILAQKETTVKAAKGRKPKAATAALAN